MGVRGASVLERERLWVMVEMLRTRGREHGMKMPEPLPNRESIG
jgi:hypothetical protein